MVGTLATNKAGANIQKFLESLCSLSKKNPIGLSGDLLIDSFLPYFIISERSGILYSSSQAKDCLRYKYGVMQVRVGYSASLIKKLLSIFGGFDVLCKCGIVMACYCSHEF